jgi:hypothetical protein
MSRLVPADLAAAPIYGQYGCKKADEITPVRIFVKAAGLAMLRIDMK